MIRIGLLSEDGALQPLLSSALGKEFQVQLASEVDDIDSLIEAAECDVLLLDLNSNNGSMKERIECSRRVIALQFPTVVMADDGLRSTAVELVRLGRIRLLPQTPLDSRTESDALPGKRELLAQTAAPDSTSAH